MSEPQTYAVGLDSSTQSLTAVVIDIERGDVIYEKSIDYSSDPRLNRFGMDFESYIVPPRQPGEADQPPRMFLASIDAMFSDMKADGIDLSNVDVINDSGQQHGHVYLTSDAKWLLASLRKPGAGGSGGHDGGLAERLEDIFSYGTAPIWKTSNTSSQVDDIRRGVGGKERMIELSGSDSPLRFTGAVIRRVGEQFPDEYEATETVQLISSFLPAVLAGNAEVPWDFGNGCGTSLMDYQRREWSDELIAAASAGLPGGAPAFAAKLPGLAAPDSEVGDIAAYFVERYGFDARCKVCAGSGDNPQSKVLVEGDLLSLGTSFVNMVSTGGAVTDPEGYANAMYDGLGRSFMFGCRTNGALVWDRVRTLHGLVRDDYAASDGILPKNQPGTYLFLWQPDNESFPPSQAFEPVRVDYTDASIEYDYPGIIESSLGIVYLYSKGFARESKDPIFLTGGVTKVAEIVRRVAAIWKRPVVTTGTVGAALGAAVAGAVVLHRGRSSRIDGESLSASVLPRADAVELRDDDVAAFHGEGGYLERLQSEYERIIR